MQHVLKSHRISLIISLRCYTHRYFIVTSLVCDAEHIVFYLYNRFLAFLINFRLSKKRPMQILCSKVFRNCRLTTEKKCCYDTKRGQWMNCFPGGTPESLIDIRWNKKKTVVEGDILAVKILCQVTMPMGPIFLSNPCGLGLS